MSSCMLEFSVLAHRLPGTSRAGVEPKGTPEFFHFARFRRSAIFDPQAFAVMLAFASLKDRRRFVSFLPE
ncbi:hypothetical protein TNCV_2427541 [Trichonephila clavipes]|nr:hypothetical protein TNCV_2427541 [Trichonephila clavipes]